MSYDLYFVHPNFTREQFEGYFAKRPLYRLAEGQAVYQNEDTGVYFSFQYNDPSLCEDEDDDAAAGVMSFNLNYYRPHFFGLEAALELSLCVEAFGFTVHDPQADGMGDGPFTAEGFLKGWNKGNVFAYSALIQGEHANNPPPTLPTKHLESFWRWNYLRKRTQKKFGTNVFVPRIFLAKIDGAAQTVAVWPDAISELIPEVDYLVIGRDELAPKRLFRASEKENFPVRFAEVREILRPYFTESFSLPSYQLPGPKTPGEVRRFVSGLKANKTPMEGLAVDAVLNREIVERKR